MIQTIIAFIFIAGGIFFLFVSSLGIIRLPDFYTRCHAVGKSETLGSMLMLIGLAIYNGFDINTFKLLVILLFIFLANPTATHILAQAAFRCGLPIWSLKSHADVDLDKINANCDNQSDDREQNSHE